jgi:hypothetical protein
VQILSNASPIDQLSFCSPHRVGKTHAEGTHVVVEEPKAQIIHLGIDLSASMILCHKTYPTPSGKSWNKASF